MTEQLDTKIKIVELDEQNSYGKFVIIPLERGCGTTPGSSLKGVLLSSLPGAAISKISIQGITHEMSTTKGIKGDVPEIVLNLEGITIKRYDEESISLSVDIKGPYALTAKDILADTDLRVKNPDHYIATLNEDASLGVQITVINRKGYKISEFSRTDKDIIGDVAIDSLFSPVKKVDFTVDNARVGQVISYDKSAIEVRTNGTTRPQDALSEGSNILINCPELFSELPNCGCSANSDDEDNQKGKKTQIVVGIKELDFSLRSFSCLKRTNINTVGDIVSHTGTDMMKIKNFGKESLNEVEEKPQEMGLAFRQEIKDEQRRVSIG